MTPGRDPLQLHPLAIIGVLAASPPHAHPARADAEPDSDPERAGAHRRLLAALSGRLESSRVPGLRSETS